MGVERGLVTLVAADGSEHDALLHRDPEAERRRERMTGRRTAVVHVHGIMGNFLVGTLRFLPAPLAKAGFPVLAADTRMGNVGQLFGEALWERSLLDLEAACAWLRDAGYDHVVLSGYSSGATLAILLAAERPPLGLRGLVGLGCPWSLPESMRTRARRFRAEPAYDVLAERAAALAALPEEAQRGADRVVVVERSRGPTREPRDAEVYTLRTWWQSRGPEAVPAMAHRQIGRIAAPILLVQGTADRVVHPEEAHALERAARAGASPDVALRMVEGVDHDFAGGEMATLALVTRWLGEHG